MTAKITPLLELELCDCQSPETCSIPKPPMVCRKLAAMLPNCGWGSCRAEGQCRGHEKPVQAEYRRHPRAKPVKIWIKEKP